MDFPGNSHTSKIKVTETTETTETSEAPEAKKPEPTGKVTRRKKSVGKQFKEMFASEGENFRDWLIADMLIPTVKGMLVTIVNQVSTGFQQGLEEKFFGTASTQQRPTITRPTSGPTGVIPYNRFGANASATSGTRMVTPNYQPKMRRSNDVEEVVFEAREDAVNVLLYLEGKIDKYRHVTVGDFYEYLPDMEPTSTDHEWGWFNLTRARPVPIRSGGYVISFPPPEPIDSGR